MAWHTRLLAVLAFVGSAIIATIYFIVGRRFDRDTGVFGDGKDSLGKLNREADARRDDNTAIVGRNDEAVKQSGDVIAEAGRVVESAAAVECELAVARGQNDGAIKDIDNALDLVRGALVRGDNRDGSGASPGSKEVR